MNDNKSQEFHTVRGYQMINNQSGRLTPAMEDYLEMIYRLSLTEGYTRVGKLSDVLNVKPSSVSKMICKLTELEYLKYERYEIIILTGSGKEKGAFLLDRHNTVEEFLLLLGVPDTLEETELIEHSLNTGTVERLKTLLEFFKKDIKLQNDFAGFQQKKTEEK